MILIESIIISPLYDCAPVTLCQIHIHCLYCTVALNWNENLFPCLFVKPRKWVLILAFLDLVTESNLFLYHLLTLDWWKSIMPQCRMLSLEDAIISLFFEILQHLLHYAFIFTWKYCFSVLMPLLSLFNLLFATINIQHRNINVVVFWSVMVFVTIGNPIKISGFLYMWLLGSMRAV